MTADTHNFTIEEGTTSYLSITWQDDAEDPIDLTGYTAVMDTVSGVTLASPTNITLGGAAGTIVVEFTPTISRLLSTGKYELDLTSGSGEVTRLLKGRIRVKQEVAA